MAIKIKVPALPESIVDATVAAWHKKPGDRVDRDEILLELETDKVMLEVPALQAGILERVLKPEGSKVSAQEILGILVETTAAGVHTATSATISPTATTTLEAPHTDNAKSKQSVPSDHALSPATRRLAAEQGLQGNTVAQIQGTGKGGRVTKEDLLTHAKVSESTPPHKTSASILSGTETERPESESP